MADGLTGIAHTLARAGDLLDPCAGPHETALRHWMGWSIFCPMGLSNCFFFFSKMIIIVQTMEASWKKWSGVGASKTKMVWYVSPSLLLLLYMLNKIFFYCDYNNCLKQGEMLFTQLLGWKD